MSLSVGCRFREKNTDRVPNMVARIFHAVTLGYYAFVLGYWMQMNIPLNMGVNMPNLRYNWWQYLTVWNMAIQGGYFVISFACDVLQSIPSRKSLIDLKERLEWWRDTLFQGLTLPICMCVFVNFWAVFAYDRELVYPSRIDTIIPFWFNHVLHTAIVFFPWAEAFIRPQTFEQFKFRYLLGMGVLGAYNLVFIGASCWQGYFTYPLFGMMTPIQRILFYALNYSLYTTAYLIGCKANDKICGKISSESDVESLIEKRFEIVSPRTDLEDQVWSNK